MRNIAKIVFLLILINISFSCKTVFIPTDKDTSKEAEAIINQSLQQNLQYDFINLRFSAKLFNEDNSDSFKGNLRIQKDSLIWLSVRSFNIEGARIVLTNDSIKMINRPNKSYFVGELNFVKQLFNLDFDYQMFQSLITNSLFFYPNNHQYNISEFIKCEDKEYHCVKRRAEIVKTTKSAVGVDYNEVIPIIQTLKIYPKIYRIAELVLENPNENQKITINYNKMIKHNERYFPSEINIVITGEKFNMNVSLNIDNINFDKESLNFPFSIPSKYEPIKLEKENNNINKN